MCFFWLYFQPGNTATKLTNNLRRNIMTRINAIDHETAEGPSKELLDAVKAKLGFAPNMMKTMAQSPSVLEAYLNFSGILGTTLDAKLRERIAMVTAELDGCRYCASANVELGKL